jgi:hypothetical protein
MPAAVCADIVALCRMSPATGIIEAALYSGTQECIANDALA